MRFHSINVNSNNFAQVDNDFSSVDSDLPISNDISFISYQLLQDLCVGYGYSSGIEMVSECCNDDFLQEYAIKCGYVFSEDFLSVMDKHKINFIGKVDSTLTDLYGSFYHFLNELNENNGSTADLMNETTVSFSKRAYDLRAKCVCILQCNIIPVTIKSIFDSNVIDIKSEFRMSYSEMEKLFLYFVTNLEKIIMIKIMQCWRSFYDKRDLLSLIPEVDYSNPFVCARNFNGVTAPVINFPASFANKFGACISFMAIAKIDEMMSDFIDKCNYVLKKNIFHRCYCIFNRGSTVDDYVKELRDKFRLLLEEEFERKIIEEKVRYRFGNFLNDVLIWNNIEKIDRVFILNKIIEHMHDFLVNTGNSDLHNIIRFFQDGNKLGVYIHPDDDCKILSIRIKFSAKARKVVRDKFCAMLKEEYKFLDGTVIDIVDWVDISKKLSPVAHEAVKHLVDAERKELSTILSNAFVVEDICVFDGYSAGTRKATHEDIATITKNYIELVHTKNINLYSRVWMKLIVGKKHNMLKSLGVASEFVESGESVSSVTDNIVGSVATTDGDDSLMDSSSVKIEFPAIIWGLNLHREDYMSILGIKRKFSMQIRDHLTELFSGMYRRRTVLPSGRVLRKYSWDLISSELSEVAMKSLESINENRYTELVRFLAKARVVGVNDNSCSSCVFREITDDEKNHFMRSAREFIDKNSRVAIKTLWSRMVNKSFIRYGYKEKYQDIDIVDLEGSWGVKLRYSDNVAILNTRKKFSSKIRGFIYNKFSCIAENSRKFKSPNYIGEFSWFKVSKKLFPIAKNEASHILECERKELEGIISKARVVVDYKVDRSLTDKEKSTVLENIMDLVYRALKILFKRVWNDIIRCNVTANLSDNLIEVRDRVVANVSDIDSIIKSSPASVDIIELEEGYIKDGYRIRLCYEDDVAILNIRKKFSSEIHNCVGNIFSEMISKGYKFNDDTIVDKLSWRKVSKKIFPIIKKEIDPIIENERMKISDVLSESRACILSSDGSVSATVTRDLTSEERSFVLKNIMKYVYKRAIINLSRMWNKIIRLQSISLVDIKEPYRLEVDNIRLEFIGNLGAIVSDAIDTLSSGIDKILPNLEHINFNASNLANEKSRSLFKKGGFLSRVESLLSVAQVIDLYGKDRFITDEEKKRVLKEFLDIISSDVDCLVKKRVIEKFSDSSLQYK
ncbi:MULTISPECIES: hypothetical protein [Candidatus Ichthyocystis]|nr:MULTISPECIES: hypothetical protein [Ichthyocystis]